MMMGRRRESEYCVVWNFANFLYVSVTSVVSYIVGIEIFLFFCYRQQERKGKKGGRAQATC